MFAVNPKYLFLAGLKSILKFRIAPIILYLNTCHLFETPGASARELERSQHRLYNKLRPAQPHRCKIILEQDFHNCPRPAVHPWRQNPIVSSDQCKQEARRALTISGIFAVCSSL